MHLNLRSKSTRGNFYKKNGDLTKNVYYIYLKNNVNDKGIKNTLESYQYWVAYDNC